MPKLSPSKEGFPADDDNKVRALLAAYEKHAAELLAIEGSQDRMMNLVLGVYSAGLALLTGLLKDSKSLLQGPEHTLSVFAWALIVVAVLIGFYTIYMSSRRAAARHSVREGITRVDQALGFFESNRYLKGQPLYPDDWLYYPAPGFLDLAHVIVLAAGAAFIAAVYFIAVS